MKMFVGTDFSHGEYTEIDQSEEEEVAKPISVFVMSTVQGKGRSTGRGKEEAKK